MAVASLRGTANRARSAAGIASYVPHQPNKAMPQLYVPWAVASQRGMACPGARVQLTIAPHGLEAPSLAKPCLCKLAIDLNLRTVMQVF